MTDPNDSVALQMSELNSVLQVGSLPIRKSKVNCFHYPSRGSLSRVQRMGRNFYLGDVRVGVTEIELIEHPEFVERAQVASEISALLRGYTLSAPGKSPWSVAETCIVLVVLYDHSFRSDKMRKATLNTAEFHSEVCRLTGLPRNFESWKRKIHEIKEQKLNLADMKVILEYLQEHIGSTQRINDYKITKTLKGLYFEPKGSGIVGIATRPPRQQTELKDEPPGPRQPVNPVIVERELFEAKKHKEEQMLRDISEVTGLRLVEIRHMWQLCQLDIQLLLSDVKRILQSDQSDTDEG